MAYAHSAQALRELEFTHSPARKGEGLLARLFAALAAARQRDADRQIARYLAGHGGKFTDETEREIERRFLSSSSNW